MLKMPKWLVHRTSLRTTPPSPRPHHAWRRTWGNHRIGHRRSVAISFHLGKALSSSAVNVSGKGPGDSPLSSSLFFPTGLSLVVDHNDWFLPFACSLLPGCHNGFCFCICIDLFFLSCLSPFFGLTLMSYLLSFEGKSYKEYVVIFRR